MKKTFKIFADYFQFYLWDKEAAPEAPSDYTDEDLAIRMKAAPNVVVIQPARNVFVPVEFEVSEHAPEPELADWDHVAEASLELPSGRLEIHECTGGSIDSINLVPGTYRVRAYFGALEELSEDRLKGNDHYRVVVWPAPFAPINVLKQFGVRNAS